MLAGIRTGKKKQRTDGNESSAGGGVREERAWNDGASSSTGAASPHLPVVPHRLRANEPSTSTNRAVADRLRQALDRAAVPSSSSGEAVAWRGGESSISAESSSRLPASLHTRQPEATHDPNTDTESGTVVRVSSGYSKRDDMTIQEMVAEEKAASASLVDQEARALMRQFKRRGNKRLSQRDRDNDDDDDVEDDSVYLGEEASDKARQRQLHRHQAQHRSLERSLGVGNRCPWWLRSSGFDQSCLVAVGHHVSVVVAPPDLSLVPFEHLYLVPLEPIESLAGADAHVWDEIHHFQTTLQKLFHQQQKDLVYCETYLPRNRGFQQARFECIAVPHKYWLDAPLRVKAALHERASENEEHGDGAYNRIRPTHATRIPLRCIVPSSRNKGSGGGQFPYVHIQYGEVDGFAQLIENPSSFPKDLALDVVAGLLRQDPLRFRHRHHGGSGGGRHHHHPQSSSGSRPFAAADSHIHGNTTNNPSWTMRDLLRHWDEVADDGTAPSAVSSAAVP